MKLENDIDRLGCWAKIWGYEIPTGKMQYDAADNEIDKKINAGYSLEDAVLQNVKLVFDDIHNNFGDEFFFINNFSKICSR